MNLSTKQLREILVEPGYISEADFKKAEDGSVSQSKRLEDVLVFKDLIKDENLGLLIADRFGFVFVDLRKEKIDEEILDLIPESVARHNGVIAFGEDGKGIKLAMVDPYNLKIKHLIEKRAGKPIQVFFVTNNDFKNVLAKYKANIKVAFNRILKQIKDQTLSQEERDEQIVNIVDMMLLCGYQNKASDIHIEPYADKVLARFRIDGVMHDVLDMPRDLSDLILTRIKIMARMRTDQHRAAMDGKLKFQSQDEKVDVRVSIVPVTGGENVVMRILSGKSRQFSLTELGMSSDDLKKVKRTIKNPHGMIVVTGPTGSGKTTTVYAVMKILNTRDVHISSIEDPVEYDIGGISQIQVNVKTNLTFAKGLKAIVRQDPDIIMIGEVRDEETADIAVNSAMTGHLVLTTLHANDAATTLPRFLDMNIEPYLLASTVNVIVAQRLVRKICFKCRMSYKVTDSIKNIIKNNPSIESFLKERKSKKLDDIYLYKGAGCEICHKTGFLGRVGIFEVLEMNESIKDLVMNRSNSDDITEEARKSGMLTILEDGVEKVLNGITTIEEVIRVTKE